jgi:threonine dehydrogenase-like Zn-dependent dehydrogenase
VFIGISGNPSLIDSRTITLKDLKIRGILSASPGLVGAIELLSKKIIDPRPLIAGVVTLEDSSDVLNGIRKKVEGAGPKIHIQP